MGRTNGRGCPARSEIGAVVRYLACSAQKPLQSLPALSRRAKSDTNRRCMEYRLRIPKRGTLSVPCVSEFRTVAATFHDQESRSKHPMLFPRATIRLYWHLREVSRARVAQLFIDVCRRE